MFIILFFCINLNLDVCKGTKYIMIESGLTRTEICTELSPRSKLGGLLRRNSVQTLLNIVRVKAVVTFEMSLSSKLVSDSSEE